MAFSGATCRAVAILWRRSSAGGSVVLPVIAYSEINAFEEQLVESVLLFKFWLSISPEEQKRHRC